VACRIPTASLVPWRRWSRQDNSLSYHHRPFIFNINDQAYWTGVALHRLPRAGFTDDRNTIHNILVQLFKQRGEISKSMMKSLGFNWEGAKPTPAEYKSWLQEEIQKFGRTIIIIDALDELRTTELCKQLIHELQSLKPPISLLVTSRSQRQLPFSGGSQHRNRSKTAERRRHSLHRKSLEKWQQLRNHVQADPSIKDLAIKC
jgi:hypothetical protein